MENTSLSCDCSAIWLAEWLRNPDSHSLLEFDRITCYQEYSKTYLKVVDVDSKALKRKTFFTYYFKDAHICAKLDCLLITETKCRYCKDVCLTASATKKTPHKQELFVIFQSDENR